jgi:hypothetical protein
VATTQQLPTGPTARRTLRITASAQFVKALVDVASQGLRTHCSDSVLGDLWLSDNEPDRAEAARLCAGCPVFGPCGDVATANGEKFGVWSGRDFTPPKPVATGKAA